MANNLTGRQAKAISSLVSQGSIAAAAADAGVSRQTLYKWMRQSAIFRDALADATKETLESLSRSLTSLGDQAVAVVRDTMNDSDIPPAVRLKAAEVVLTRTMELRRMIDVETRLRALEGRIEGVHDEH